MAASGFVLLFFIMFHLPYLTGGTIALATIAPMVVLGNVAIFLGESTLKPWIEKDSALAAIKMSVRPSVRNASASVLSPLSIANISEPESSNLVFPLSRNPPMQSPSM